MQFLPMRTGRVPCSSAAQQDFMEQTLAILASMMKQAACDATLYTAEAKRTVVLPRDIELALKRLVLPGSAYWQREDLSEDTKRIRSDLFESDASSGSESDESWIVEVADEVWTETGQSPLTREMNAAPSKFDEWQPDIPFMQALKNAVTSATQSFSTS